MSQEDKLNVDEILSKIKKFPKHTKSNLNKSLIARIRIYQKIILDFEEENAKKTLENLLSAFRALYYNVCEIDTDPHIIKLDIEIIMKFADEFLDKANNNNTDIDFQDMYDCESYLFMNLGTIINRQSQKAKTKAKDVENCISLASKFLKSRDNIKTNITALTNIFAVLNHTIYNCDEKIKSENVSKVIEFVETVEKDQNIEQDTVAMCSVFLALRSISERSESLSQEQARKIFNMISAFTDKIKSWKSVKSSTVLEALLKPIKHVLIELKNPAKVSAEQCLNLIQRILNKDYELNKGKSDQESVSELNFGLLETIIDIVNYYGKDSENRKIISQYGFLVKKQNAGIGFSDENKLAQFLSEKIFDIFEPYIINSEINEFEQENIDKENNENKVNSSTTPSDINQQNENNGNYLNQPKETKDKDSDKIIKNNSQTELNNQSINELEQENVDKESNENKVSDSTIPSDINQQNENNKNYLNQPKETKDKDSDKIIKNNSQTELNNQSINELKQKNIEKENNENKNGHETDEHNENQKSPKHENADKYQPTKLFTTLAVLSFIIPFIPGLIFIVVSNNRKEYPLVKLGMCLPIFSPLVFAVRAYQAYQTNTDLETKKELEETTNNDVSKYGDTTVEDDSKDVTESEAKSNNVPNQIQGRSR